MSTLVIGNGYNSYKANSKKSGVVLADGSYVHLVVKDATHISVRQTPTNSRSSSTERINLTVSTLSENPRVAIELGHDGTYVDVFYRITGWDGIKHRRVTIAGWTAAAEVTVINLASSYTLHSLDVAMSETGAVLVGLDYANTAPDRAGYIIMLRTTAGNWVQIEKTTFDAASSYKSNVYEASIAWYKGHTAGVRRFAFIYSSVSASGVERKVKIRHGSVDEADGTPYSAKDLTPLATNDLATSGSYAQQPRKHFMFRLADGTILVAVVQVMGSKMEMYVSILQITSAGANGAADTVTATTVKVGEVAISSGHLGSMAATFGYDADGIAVVNFIAPHNGYADKKVRLLSLPWKMTGASSGELKTGMTLSYPETAPHSVAGGSGWALTYSKGHEISTFVSPDDYRIDSVGRQLTAPFLMTPAAGELVLSSKPTVGAFMLNFPWSVIAPEMYPVVQVASDAGFTTAFQEFESQNGQPMTPYSSGGTSYTKYADVWGGVPLAPGLWYGRVALRDVYGNQTGWVTLATPFQVSHPAFATNLQPPIGGVGDSVRPYVDAGGFGNVSVGWTFSDASLVDYQTAYKIDVYSGATLIATTGKVTSANNLATIPIPVAYKNMYLTYTVQVWDQYDTSASPFAVSAIGSFITYEPPVVDTIGVVTGAGTVVNSAVPVFSYTTTIPGPYPLVQLLVEIKREGVVVYSNTIEDPVGDSNLEIGAQILENNKSYSITIGAKDAKGMVGYKTLAFTTVWTPPDAPAGVAVSTANYNTENAGYISVTWDDTERDTADFLSWNIYRRIDQIDALGVVYESGPVELLGKDRTTQAAYEFKDYTAPSGTKVTYWITQVVQKFEAEIESGHSTEVSVTPQSDGYWFIDPDPADVAKASFKAVVNADSYTHKYEEQEMFIIGRGRRVDRGDDYGIDGSMTCQLRDTWMGMTARQKKRRIEYLKDDVRDIYLRTPFGDVWKVNLGEVSVSRIAGVGIAEFCDVTIPYAEVY